MCVCMYMHTNSVEISMFLQYLIVTGRRIPSSPEQSKDPAQS